MTLFTWLWAIAFWCKLNERLFKDEEIRRNGETVDCIRGWCGSRDAREGGRRRVGRSNASSEDYQRSRHSSAEVNTNWCCPLQSGEYTPAIIQLSYFETKPYFVTSGKSFLKRVKLLQPGAKFASFYLELTRRITRWPTRIPTTTSERYKQKASVWMIRSTCILDQ